MILKIRVIANKKLFYKITIKLLQNKRENIDELWVVSPTF
jgi:hypothetical protein